MAGLEDYSVNKYAKLDNLDLKGGSYTHHRDQENPEQIVCGVLLEKKKKR